MCKQEHCHRKRTQKACVTSEERAQWYSAHGIHKAMGSNTSSGEKRGGQTLLCIFFHILKNPTLFCWRFLLNSSMLFFSFVFIKRL